MPEKPFSWVPKEKLLSYEDLFAFLKIGIDEGVTKIRITGGEPLIREDLDQFIKMIHDYKPDIDLALTTNGYFLKDQAHKLYNAGLKRINISLDTLNAQTAYKIAQKDVLPDVLEGIENALSAGIKIKINCVPLKDINDTEIHDLIEYAKTRHIEIRFIEYMENEHAPKGITGLNEVEIKEIIHQRYNYKALKRQDSSPAMMYEMDGGYRFGIIDPHKHDFCESCNRIRLTAEGDLIPCLYFDEAQSIHQAVKERNITRATEILRDVIRNKPEKNRWNEEDFEKSKRAFYETGG
jgi:cyclic pyranopterin phosphate synthase